MNGKVIRCDDLGLNDLQVLPLTEPNVLWTEGVGEEEGEGGREEGEGEEEGEGGREEGEGEEEGEGGREKGEGEEEGEGGREEVPSQVTHEYLILTQWYGSMTMKL